MINQKDVIRMRVPYPSISDQLALTPHMYICQKSQNPEFKFVKCQTLKPYMLIQGVVKPPALAVGSVNSDVMQHYWDETPDITRNPFQRTTRIDCDKLFVTNSVNFSSRMRTTSRTDVCDELFDAVLKELSIDGYDENNLNEVDLQKLNSLISTVCH